MATLADLRTACRNTIADAALFFSDAQLDGFINRAIAEISISFPRLKIYTASAVVGQKVYDLPTDFRSVVTVEYPPSLVPRKYLYRLPRTDFRFALSDDYYDIEVTQDAGHVGHLYLSITPANTSLITLTYMGEHQSMKASGDTTTVMERHLGLIQLYARWGAWAQMATIEGMNPDPLKGLSAGYERNAREAQAAFEETLQRMKEQESESAVETWRMDRYDRIY
jgi:hypothetical protein